MLPKLGLGRPGGSRVLHTGAHALKDRPAGRGARRWTGEAALELRGPWLPGRGAAAFPAFPDGPRRSAGDPRDAGEVEKLS